jgi:hypothetical protein
MPRIPHPPIVTALALALALGAAAGCGGDRGDQAAGGGEAAPAAPRRIENPQLAIALAGIESSGFELDANDGATLRLTRPAAEGSEAATLTYEAGEAQVAGVNLVDAVNQQKQAVEARPGGQFFGQVQLMSQLGNAYSTRGRYTGEGGGEVEELRLFAVHPAGDRLLSLVYVYPAQPGGTQARIEEAMAGLGLVEPLDTGAAGDDGTAGEGAAEPAAEPDASAAGGS